MGLDVYLRRARTPEDEEGVEIELPSSKYPEHLFKIGYFRSSYNDAGTNTVLRQNVGTDLYEIMGYNDEDDYVQRSVPWAAAKARALSVLADWRALPWQYCCSGVTDLGHGPHDRDTALALARKQLPDLPLDHAFDSWMTREGMFAKNGLKVVAVMPGKSYGTPCAWVVTRAKPSEHYAQALEIVIETCEWALSQPDAGADLILHWSS